MLDYAHHLYEIYLFYYYYEFSGGNDHYFNTCPDFVSSVVSCSSYFVIIYLFSKFLLSYTLI